MRLNVLDQPLQSPARAPSCATTLSLPDFPLIKCMSFRGVSTPLMYAPMTFQRFAIVTGCPPNLFLPSQLSSLAKTFGD